MRIYILIALLFASCAARKVDVNKIDVKKDSVIETKVAIAKTEVSYKTDSTNIITNIEDSEITIMPIDSSKTIMVDGKSYKNVVLRIKKNKVNNLYVNNKKESNTKRVDSIGTTSAKKTERSITKNKVIDKKMNYWFLFYWLIFIIALYLLWKNKERLFIPV